MNSTLQGIFEIIFCKKRPVLFLVQVFIDRRCLSDYRTFRHRFATKQHRTIYLLKLFLKKFLVNSPCSNIGNITINIRVNHCGINFWVMHYFTYSGSLDSFISTYKYNVLLHPQKEKKRKKETRILMLVWFMT